VPQKKGKQPLTLIVVPHSERAPISFRFPAWLVPLVSTLSLALLACLGYFVVRSHHLNQELVKLQQEGHVQTARESEMRDTILAQQDEVQDLSQQVGDFQSEWAGVRALSADIQSLIGLPTPTSTPIASPEANSDTFYGSSAQVGRFAAFDTDAKGGQIRTASAGRDALMAVERSQDLVRMQVTLPRTLNALMDLRDEILVRLDRIEPEQRTNPVELEEQLRLLAAAPHLWPTESHRISSMFGYRTLWGKLEFHKGIDIPVWYGTKVFATKDGTVKQAAYRGGFGWSVELQHEMGFATIYGHNSQLLVSDGDKVKAGDVIALSGNSGRSTGPHLHYEIQLNGASVDPLKYLGLDEPNAVEEE